MVYEVAMTLEALVSNELPNFLVYDTISSTPHSLYLDYLSQSSFTYGNAGGDNGCYTSTLFAGLAGGVEVAPGSSVAVQGKKKKRRRQPRKSKNKEEEESQRMTHIAVERNRRRQMNEHLAVLRTLMPESYLQRGDQASIVGGAIDFLKELEQLLQSLEAQKRALQQQQQTGEGMSGPQSNGGTTRGDQSTTSAATDANSPPFGQFFAYPQFTWCHAPRGEHQLENQAAAVVADIEVVLIETHANLKILSPKRPRQLLKIVAGLQALKLSILHLNVTTLDSMVLYSFNVKVEEGCNLTSVDDIAAAVHHMLSLIEAESSMS